MAEIDIPSYFLCPITLEIMKDPVTICTGMTYDRESIEKWIFSQQKDTCPTTKQVLENLDLTPNIILRRMIQSWCHLHAADGVERLPTPKAPITYSQLQKLLEDARSPQSQLKSLQTLRSIAAQNQTNCRLMESSAAPEFLSSLIVKKTLELKSPQITDSLEESDLRKTRDESLNILYSLQLSEPSLKTITKSDFIESLAFILQSGSYESRAYASMLLKSIAEVADPSILISLNHELFSELTELLKDQVSLKASKATLKVLISCLPWGRNRIKAVESGAVPVLIDLLLESSDKRISEIILTLLDLLCQCAEGRAELLRHAAGLAVVSKKILRVSHGASERAVRILHSISRFCATPAILSEMLQIGVAAKLCLVLQVDCGSKAKERAREILKSHARAWRNSSCIPNNLISSYPS